MFSLFFGLVLAGVVQQIFSHQAISVVSDLLPPPSAPAFRAIHASADTLPVDVYINGTKILTNVGFGKSSVFLSIPLGAAAIKVTYAGKTTSIIDGNVVLSEKRWYSAIAIGSSVGTGKEKLQGILVADLANVPASGKGKIRVVHAAVDVPFVDVYAVAPGVLIEDSQPIIKNLGFGQSVPASDELALEVPEGEYTVHLTFTGTKFSFYHSPLVKLFNGDDYLLAAVRIDEKVVNLLAVDVFGQSNFL